MKRVVLTLCCVAAFSTSALALDGPAPSKLSAAQIVEKNVVARGGLGAWRGVEALRLSGEMDAGGKQDTKLPFVLSLKRPLKSRLEIRFEGQTALQTWDGTQGWKIRPFLNRDEIEAYSAAEAKSAVADTELDGPLVDYARKGTAVELVGIEPVEGKNAYKLKLTTKGGVQRNLWVDATSFLEVKMDGEPRKLDGRIHKVAVYSRDYKKVSGVTVPYTLETVVEGVKKHHKITIQTVVVNPGLDDELFAKPTLAMTRATWTP